MAAVTAAATGRRYRPLPLVYDDGGRKAAGFRGHTGDCVVRAIAVAGQRDYRDVYDDLYAAARAARLKRDRISPRLGVHRRVFVPYLDRLGWAWTPTMHVGSGCTAHLRVGEVPMTGRHVLNVSRHVVAVVDGFLHDTADDVARDGTRCVYGWWTPPG